MFGPLQARPSYLCEHLSQAPRPFGPSLPCATSRIAPHETIPLVNETLEDLLQRTSHSRKGVALLLSHPLNMARPHFSPEWSQNGRNSLLPHGYDGHIIDRLGRGLRRPSPLVSEQVPLPESSSRSMSLEPCSRFSVEAETQAGGMDAEPSESSPDLGSVRRSGSGSLYIAGVVPMPT